MSRVRQAAVTSVYTSGAVSQMACYIPDADQEGSRICKDLGHGLTNVLLHTPVPSNVLSLVA